MEIITEILLFVLGAMLGSFACCQVWRLKKRKDKSKRSHCMNCNYQLKWYDNIPIVSWLCLGGRCRKCRKAIGWAEILSEIGLGLTFLLSFLAWPEYDKLMAGDGFEVAKFVVFLVLLVALAISFIYDFRWQEMPSESLYAGIGIAVVFAGIEIARLVCAGQFELDYIWSMLGALGILPGLYYLLYFFSHERWVGGGDWILNIALALTLGNFWLAIFAMFLANVLACLISLPATISKRDLNMRIPFGPFLIIAFWLVYMIQTWVLGFVVI